MSVPGEDQPLRFSNEKKLRKQMQQRGWTEKEIREALLGATVPAIGKKGPATRFIHPTTGKSLVVDNATGEIFHLGKAGYQYG
ncbi:MAG TPA: colicin E5-related ribonuclease [Tepidisphaeraceae bacterium]|jgi:hypothetical protein